MTTFFGLFSSIVFVFCFIEFRYFIYKCFLEIGQNDINEAWSAQNHEKLAKFYFPSLFYDSEAGLFWIQKPDFPVNGTYLKKWSFDL